MATPLAPNLHRATTMEPPENARIPAIARRYTVPPTVLAALERVFDERDLERVAVIYRPVYVRSHLCFIGARFGSVTRPETIYTNIPEPAFFALDAHVLHEYYHVVRQWRGERMTRTGYLLRCARREREAREFVERNLGRYRAYLCAAHRRCEAPPLVSR